MMVQVIRMINIFNSVMTAAHGPPFAIIALFPHYLALPLLFMIAACTFFHLSLKTREGSKLSWVLAILFLMALPFPLYRVSQLHITPLIQQFGYSALYRSFESWNYVVLTVVTIAVITLIIFFKNFAFEGRSLQKKSKVLLSLFFLVIAIPTILYSFYMYYQAHYNNYDYDTIQKAIPFHVYTPTYLPEGRSFETVFYIPKKGVLPKEKTVQVDVNYSIKDIMNGKKSGLISLKQSSIDTAFDYQKFITDYRKEIPDMKKIILTVAKGNNAVIKQKKDAKYIIFVSKSNTLIIISAFYIDNKELLKFANSLK